MNWSDVENKIKTLAKEVKDDTELANSREKSLVLTKLDEARMWAAECS